MKKRIRFGELSVGDEFEWGGTEYRKLTDRRGASLNPRNEAIFNRSDSVRIEVMEEEDDDFYPMFGITGKGSGNPNFGAPPFIPGSSGGSSGGWGQVTGSSSSSGGSGSSRSQGTVAGTGMTVEELEDFYGIGPDISGSAKETTDTCNVLSC